MKYIRRKIRSVAQLDQEAASARTSSSPSDAETSMLHEIAWTLRVSEVGADAAQRSLEWYAKQPAKDRHKTAWANSLVSARAVIDLLRGKKVGCD